MKRPQAEAVASLVRTIRSEWDHWAIVEQCMSLGGTDPDIAAHALTVAGSPAYRSPAMLSHVEMRRYGSEPTGNGEAKPGDKRMCDICTRSEWACQKAQQNTGLDFHKYRPIGYPDPDKPNQIHNTPDPRLLELIASAGRCARAAMDPDPSKPEPPLPPWGAEL